MWKNIADLRAYSFICSYCSKTVSSSRGISDAINSSKIMICPNCTSPTYFTKNNRQIPGPKIGESIKHISDGKINSLYEEARTCHSHGAYSASVMCCRKLLMHIAVSEGAEENKNFKHYVDFLLDEHLPKNAKEWVELIREKGNFANHEIELMTEEDSKHLIYFSGMLLKNLYEFPGIATNLTTTEN